jgi:hypothetical protein
MTNEEQDIFNKKVLLKALIKEAKQKEDAYSVLAKAKKMEPSSEQAQYVVQKLARYYLENMMDEKKSNLCKDIKEQINRLRSKESIEKEEQIKQQLLLMFNSMKVE